MAFVKLKYKSRPGVYYGARYDGTYLFLSQDFVKRNARNLKDEALYTVEYDPDTKMVRVTHTGGGGDFPLRVRGKDNAFTLGLVPKMIRGRYLYHDSDDTSWTFQYFEEKAP